MPDRLYHLRHYSSTAVLCFKQKVVVQKLSTNNTTFEFALVACENAPSIDYILSYPPVTLEILQYPVTTIES